MTIDEPSYNVELIISNKSRATINKDCLYPTSNLGVEALSFYRFINVETYVQVLVLTPLVKSVCEYEYEAPRQCV